MSSSRSLTQVQQTRALATAIAAVVVFDAAWVRAPFLAFMAVPFVVVAWRYRQGRVVTNAALALWCALYAVTGVAYALSNGLHSPAEDGHASTLITPGDFAFVYIGTPLAVLLGVQVGLRLTGRGRTVALADSASA